MDEAPFWSHLEDKWQIREVILFFVFRAALSVPLIIFVQNSSAEVLAVLSSLHVL